MTDHVPPRLSYPTITSQNDPGERMETLEGVPERLYIVHVTTVVVLLPRAFQTHPQQSCQHE